MKRCVVCGKIEESNNSRYCRDCGGDLTAIKVKPAAVCRNCAAPLVEGAAFCGNCGSAISAPENENIPEETAEPPTESTAYFPTAETVTVYGEQPERKKSRTPLIITLIVILISATVGSVLVYRNIAARKAAEAARIAEENRNAAKKDAAEVVENFMGAYVQNELDSYSYSDYFEEDSETEDIYNEFIAEWDTENLAEQVEMLGYYGLDEIFGDEQVEEWEEIVAETAADMVSYEQTDAKVSENAESVSVELTLTLPDESSYDEPSDKRKNEIMEEYLGFDLEDTEAMIEAWSDKESMTLAELAQEYGDLDEEELIEKFLEVFVDEWGEAVTAIVEEGLESVETAEYAVSMVLKKQGDGGWKISELEY